MRIDPARPNIIMVLIDSLRYDFVKAMPFLGQLIGEGVYFNRMYSYAPYTRASGHALLSGMYGTRSGMRSWRASWFKGHRIITLAEYLRNVGYRTYADFSYILDWPPHGFDIITTFKSYEYTKRMFERHGVLLSRIYEGGQDKSPFFLFLDYLNLHTRHVELRQEGKTLTPEIYGAWAREVDVYLDRLFSHATSLGFTQNTIWIILSDHGTGGWEREDEPFYGVYLYDYTIRVPCVIWGMGERGRFDDCVRTVDIQPTIMDLLGIDPWESERLIPMNGESLLPIIRGKEKGRRIAYFETHSPEWGPWKSERPNVFGATDGKWKFILTPTDSYVLDNEDKSNEWGGNMELIEEVERRRREGEEYASRYFGSGGRQTV